MRRRHIVLPQRWHVNLQKNRAMPRRWLRILLLAGAVTAAALLSVIALERHMRPIVEQMAKVQVNYLASMAINETISERLTDDGIDYQHLVYFEKDVSGRITAVKTDMLKINRLKSGIVNQVYRALNAIEPSELGVPLGNVLNGDLLAGRGPRIPVRIVPLGTASAEFHNVFSSAGINQTRHQIMMDVIADISVLLPGYASTTNVRVEVAVAETIIIGGVPDSYTNFENGELFSEKSKHDALFPSG